MQSLTLHIEGMSCGHCLNAVTRALQQVEGARIVSVRIGRADVEIPAGITAEQVVSAIDRAGYRATAVASA